MIARYKVLGAFLTAIFVSSQLAGQPDCRSSVPGFLKPFKKDGKLSWAWEGTFGYGLMNDRNVMNGLNYAGFQYAKGKYRFYLEGGSKFWKNSLGGQKARPGLREAFYSYGTAKTNINAGFQTMRLGDYFLVDERALGVKYYRNWGAFKLHFGGGSVLKDFARMGTFCSVRYIYNVVRGKYEVPLGEKIGETNFSGVVLLWTPSEKVVKSNKDKNEFQDINPDEFGGNNTTQKTDDEGVSSSGLDEFGNMDSTATDEFSSSGLDEFSSGSDTNVTSTEKRRHKSKNLFGFKQAGIAAYSEFGQLFGEQRLYGGPLAGFSLPGKIDLELEALYQQAGLNNAVGFFVRLKKSSAAKNGNMTAMDICYIGKVNLDDSALFLPAFTNLFMGEIMRLEAVDMPAVQATFKYQWAKKVKPYIRLRAIQQIEGYKVNIVDVELGMRLKKRIRTTLIMSRIDSDMLDVDTPFYMARAEVRFNL